MSSGNSADYTASIRDKAAYQTSQEKIHRCPTYAKSHPNIKRVAEKLAVLSTSPPSQAGIDVNTHCLFFQGLPPPTARGSDLPSH